MESTPEQQAEGMAVVRVLAAVLERLVSANAPLAQSDPGQVTKFHALKAPGIGIQQYLERIHKYASCSTECFILALIYIDRLIQRNNFLLTELNVHRVVITAVLLAAKFFDDAYYNNAYYAKVGGVLVSEMNGLEVEFLFRINFSLHVQTDVFHKYRAELVAHAVGVGLENPGHELSYPKLASTDAQLHDSPNVVVPDTAACSPVPVREHQRSQATILAEATIKTSDPVNSHEQLHCANQMQQITPSPPPPAHPTHLSNATSVGGIVSSSSLAAVPGMAHTHPGGMMLIGPDSQFPMLQRHHSMPVNSESTVAHIAPTNSTYSAQAAYTKMVQRNHLVTPGATAPNLSYPNCPTIAPSITGLTEAEQLLMVGSTAAAYPADRSQYITQYQQNGPGVSSDIIHHYNHEPLARHHVTHVVGGGCRYNRRYSDLSSYIHDSSVTTGMHIPSQTSQYVNASSPAGIAAGGMVTGGYRQ